MDEMVISQNRRRRTKEKSTTKVTECRRGTQNEEEWALLKGDEGLQVTPVGCINKTV